MVDFGKLAAIGNRKTPKTLHETFGRLDRQVSHVELRPSQSRILELMDERISEKDLVVKLNTGGGKTTIGLLYLKHKLDHLRTPVVYVVPTNQLLDQVVEEGRRIGLAVLPWIAGESYPPNDALNGNGIITCTYDKFFNGKSTFARHDVKLIPSAIVLDDVHAGIESVRKCFCSDLPPTARAELVDLLRGDLEQLEPGAWSGVEQADAGALVEVPHWVISRRLLDIRKIVSRFSMDQCLTFAWPHLSENLNLCRLVISGTSASIALDPPIVESVPHYFEAAHRVFMSASMHDGAALVRELGCGVVAAGSPIELEGAALAGERMVIVPSLANPNFARKELGEVAALVKEVANVVVLSTSFDEAKFWLDYGATIATNENIREQIHGLRRRDRGSIVVIVQRYDGIDLPDTACRLLIVDGLPRGDGLVDRADSDVAGGIIGVRGKVANRIEQGLGRAVRSASDYCVAILAGPDVAGFISRGVVRECLSPHTVRQIEIGEVVSRALIDSSDLVRDMVEAIMQCLRRESAWKEFYTTQMEGESSQFAAIARTASQGRKIAECERRALVHAHGRKFIDAVNEIQNAISLTEGDVRARGVLKQVAAKYQSAIDPAQAMLLQSSAFTDNNNVSRPPKLMPANIRKVSTQAGMISTWLSSFTDKNGALLELDDLKASLSFERNHSDVEKAVCKLGELVGAESSRPEDLFGRGPDNLWIFGDVAFVIEMKSKKNSKLFKSDAEQLQHSILWVEQNYPTMSKCIGYIGSKSIEADVVDDFAFGARVFDEHAFIEIVSRLRELSLSLCVQGPLFSGAALNVQRALGDFKLSPDQIGALSTAIR